MVAPLHKTHTINPTCCTKSGSQMPHWGESVVVVLVLCDLFIYFVLWTQTLLLMGK